MKIPKKLKIGGHTYKVEITSDKNKCDELGICDRSNNTIYILAGQSRSQMEATLIHEILHAANDLLGSTIDGHRLLDSLAEQIYQVFNDNKLLKT